MVEQVQTPVLYEQQLSCNRQLWLNTLFIIATKKPVKRLVHHLEDNTTCLFTFDYYFKQYVSSSDKPNTVREEAVREGPLAGLCPTLINWQTHIDPAAPQSCALLC